MSTPAGVPATDEPLKARASAEADGMEPKSQTLPLGVAQVDGVWLGETAGQQLQASESLHEDVLS